jgi:hypothetical protein
MAFAICIKCGGRKEHALAQCGQCQFVPHSKEDEAKSFYLSTHNLSPEALVKAGEAIEQGVEINYSSSGRLKGVVGAATAKVKIYYGLPLDHWKKLGVAALVGAMIGTCVLGLISLGDLF